MDSDTAFNKFMRALITVSAIGAGQWLATALHILPQ